MLKILFAALLLVAATGSDIPGQFNLFRLNPKYGYIEYRQIQDSAWQHWYDVVHVTQSDPEHVERLDTLVRLESAISPVLCDTHSVAILPDADSGYQLIAIDLIPVISWDTVAWFPSDSIAAWMQARPNPRSILCSHHYSRRYDVVALQFDEDVVFVGGMREGRPRVLGDCQGVDIGNIEMSNDFSQFIVLCQARRIDEWGKTRYFGHVRICVFDCKSEELSIAHEYFGNRGFLPRRRSEESPIYFLIGKRDSVADGSKLWELDDNDFSQVPDSGITPEVESLYGDRLREMLR